MGAATRYASRSGRYGAKTLGRYASKATVYLFVVALGIAFGGPFLWALSSSVKPINEVVVFPPKWLPSVFQWQNYLEVWSMVPFGQFLINSLTIAIARMIGTVLSSALVGYGFARFRFPARDALFVILLGTLILPDQVTVIPRFLLFKEFGWLDTFKALYVPSFFGSPFGIFLYRQYFLTIRRDLDEAAKMDGANFVQVLVMVLMPLSQAVTVTVAILNFLFSWNEMFWPLIILNTPDKYPLAIGIQYFRTVAEAGGKPKEHLLMAAGMMMVFPVLVLFVTLQRYFTRSIVMSGLKG